MKKIISIVLVLMTLAGLMIPVLSVAEGAEKTRWINSPDGKNVNIYVTANGRIMYTLECGAEVQVQSLVSTPGGWSYITQKNHPNGGFVLNRFLARREPDAYEITESDSHFTAVPPYNAVVLASGEKGSKNAGLYVSPNRNSASIRTLETGDVLQVIAVGSIWNRVMDRRTGKVGYVAAEHIKRLK